MTGKYRNRILAEIQDLAFLYDVEIHDHVPVQPLAGNDYSFYIECPESFVPHITTVDHISNVRATGKDETTLRYDGKPANTPSATVRFFNRLGLA